MKYSESTYIGLGYMLEKAPNEQRSRALLTDIRAKIEEESIDERADARYLIERGRKEAREEYKHEL